MHRFKENIQSDLNHSNFQKIAEEIGVACDYAHIPAGCEDAEF